jgi:hypothetical protein
MAEDWRAAHARHGCGRKPVHAAFCFLTTHWHSACGPCAARLCASVLWVFAIAAFSCATALLGAPIR